MKLTIEEIRRASNKKLRSLLKEDLPVEIDDMISKKKEKLLVAGYGAAAKANTLLNFSGINKKDNKNTLIKLIKLINQGKR